MLSSSLSYQHSMTLLMSWVDERLQTSDAGLVAAVEGIHDDRIDQKDRQIRFFESEQRSTKSCFPFIKNNGGQRYAMKGIKWIVDVMKKQVLEVTYLVDEEVSTKCSEKKL